MHAVEQVPFLDLASEYEELEAEWFAAIRETGKQASFVLGPNVAAFEREMAAYVGAEHAVGVANGTDALILSLRACDIGPGYEVITTPFTFFATAEAISIVGAVPVFVDIDADSFNIDASGIRDRITEKTRAIIPVHLFGCPARMDEIMAIAEERGLAVIEDCAQAFGAVSGDRHTGTIGHTGCFSFYPTKILGCYGDGGMVTTNDASRAERLRRLRNHGTVGPFMHNELGYNSRLDEIQAALLRIKLRLVDRAIEDRRRVAARYSRRLQDIGVTTPPWPSYGSHAFNLYTIRTPERERIRSRLAEAKIAHTVCYELPLHLQEVYSSLGYRRGDLPVAEAAAAEVLSLPIYPGMPDAHVEAVCTAIEQGLRS